MAGWEFRRYEREEIMTMPPKRHAFVTTNRKEAFLYEADVISITAVNTEKSGACLILKLKNGDEMWILDTEVHRQHLNMASEAESIQLLAKLNRLKP
jgi:hypothetical protein